MAETARLNLVIDAAGAKASLDSVERKTKDLGRSVDSAGDRMSGAFDRAKKSIFSLGGAIAGLGVGVLTKQIVDSTVAIENITQTLTALTGSSLEAANQLDFLREISKDLGINFRVAASSYAGLTAASKNTALEGERTREIFVAISKASAVLGMSADDTRGAMRALEQMMSKGNVQAEELRGQLGERLKGAFNIAADAMGISTQELNKMLDRGEVLASDLLPKLAKELERRFGPAAVDASQRAQASFNRLDNAILELQNTIGASGLVDFLADSAEAAAEFTENAEALQAVSVSVAAIISGKLIASLSLASRESSQAAAATLAKLQADAAAEKQAMLSAKAEVTRTAALVKEAEAERVLAREVNLRGVALTNINARAANSQREYASALDAATAATVRYRTATSAATASTVALTGAAVRAKAAFAALGGAAGVLGMLATATALYAKEIGELAGRMVHGPIQEDIIENYKREHSAVGKAEAAIKSYRAQQAKLRGDITELTVSMSIIRKAGQEESDTYRMISERVQALGKEYKSLGEKIKENEKLLGKGVPPVVPGVVTDDGAGDGGLSDKERARLQTRMERLQEQFMSETELATAEFKRRAMLISQLEEEGIGTDEERRQLRIDAVRAFEEDLTNITLEQAQERREIEQQVAHAIVMNYASAAMSAASIIKGLGGKSKAAAVAALLIEKGAAAASVIANAEAAKFQVMATTPPYAWPALLASVETSKVLSLAAIAASTISGVSNIGGGASASTGQQSVQPSATPVAATVAPTPVVPQVRVVVSGGLHSDNDVRSLLDRIEEVKRDLGTQSVEVVTS